MSNAYLRVFKKIDLYDTNRSFESWFARIIIHASSDYYRYSKSETIDLIGIEHDLKVNEEIIDVLSYKEILNCISDLSPQYRMVFNMYVIDGYRHAEIGKFLSISEGTSKSNLSKAKQQLKKIMADKYEIRLENR